MMTIEEKIKNIPAKPGCYLFHDKEGRIIYIGKAGALRNRVRSYFQKSRPFHPKLQALVKRIADLEWIVTDSEVEALILENNLIKKHQPRYNIDLKDDKSYPYIRITGEDFPQVYITRKIIRDGSEYFGPYTQVKNVRHILKTLKTIFTVRSCKFRLSPQVIRKKKVALCLDYYIGKCRGPCQGLQSKEDYNAEIDRVRRFLKGRTSGLLKELQQKMQQHSVNLKFEEAAHLRDKIAALENYRNAQKVVQNDFKDRDLIAVAKEENDACAVVFKIREGKVIGRMHYYLQQSEWRSVAEIAETVIQRTYAAAADWPQEIFLQERFEGYAAAEKWLSAASGRKVALIAPKIGEKKKLLQMAEKNARFLLQELKLQKMKAANYLPHSVKALQRDLGLKNEPRRMECFDISNIQGTNAVASMVCFVNGKPKKSDYRRFKIRTKETPDDFAMMREVIRRRYTRLLREGLALPDLIVVDGGKGQLSSALQVLKELGLAKQPVIGLAKRLEEIFLPGFAQAQMLPRTSSSLKLLQQIRDEAHRFAVTFHRQQRKKRTLTSQLDQIKGLGEKRRNRLLKVLTSVKRIKETSVEEMTEKVKIPRYVAENVYNYFHRTNDR